MGNKFNIYYINYEKASEISMLFDNEIVEQIRKSQSTNSDYSGSADVGTKGSFSQIPVIGKYIPAIDLTGNFIHSKAGQVEDTVKVVSSKSTILKPVYENAKKIYSFSNCQPGDLVRIQNVSLSVINSNDVIATKAIMNGFVSQIPVEGLGNLNLSSILETLFKGSAYILCGSVSHGSNCAENLMVKIPMGAENELESEYSISDIEIGHVTVLGIYRGEFEQSEIERKINRLLVLKSINPQNHQPIAAKDIATDFEDGVFAEDTKGTSCNPIKVHYVDVIAIVQEIREQEATE